MDRSASDREPRDAVDALVAAHAEGVLHRDVKPSSLAATRDRPAEVASGSSRGPRRWTRDLDVIAVLLVIFVRPVALHFLDLTDPTSSLHDPEVTPGWLLLRIHYEVGMAVILLLLLRSRRDTIQPQPTPRSEWRRELLLGLALGFGLFFVGYAFEIVVHRLGVPGGASRWETLLRGVDARVCFSFETLFAATYEEVAFRAYLQSRLEASMPRSGLFAVVLSAGAFSFIHGYSPAASLGVYLFGMLQGFAYRRWRRLPRLIVAHGFHNLLVTWL